ncbi:MAG: universal stress protein [Minwuia sp.]|uniref:universal stress protein n=1 Tax=Minwuia sp. TaxID=2493630 RepID=UPI003A883A9B
MSDSEGQIRNFLVVVDDTPECRLAMRWAARRAMRLDGGGGVVLLRVTEPPDFQHWMGVGELMREEAREEAEQLLTNLAKELLEGTTLTPQFVIREGDLAEQVQSVIDDDKSIRILVLGASAESGGPGPLVKRFAGERSGTLRIPVTVVPGTLSRDDVDMLS